MKSFQQGQAAYVSNENVTAVFHHLNCAFDHVDEVIDSREILDDRVKDNQVKRTGLDTFKVVSTPAKQFELWQVFIPQAQSLLDVIQSDGRKIRPHIPGAMLCQTKQQQAGATTDL